MKDVRWTRSYNIPRVPRVFLLRMSAFYQPDGSMSLGALPTGALAPEVKPARTMKTAHVRIENARHRAIR